MSKARDLSNFISDATVDATEIADLAVTHAKLHTDMNLSSKTLTFAANQISGNAIDGGVISNFASTGIDDNSSATAVTILSDGKVGIGITSPIRQLHLASSVPSIRLEDTDVSGAYNDIVHLSTGELSIRVDHGNVQSNSSLSFLIDADEKMRIDSSGNIKFGPNGEGYINGAAQNTYNSGFNVNADDFSTWLNFSGYQGGTTKFRDLIIGNGKNGRVVTVDGSSGNVGIGTHNPTAKLHVEGTFQVRTSSNQSFNDSSNANNLTMTDSKAHFNLDGADKDFQISSDTVTHALFVQGSYGNVGIGTSSPSESLHVEGDARLADAGSIQFGSSKYQTLTGGAGSNDLLYRTYATHIFKTATGPSSKTDGTERMRINGEGISIGTGTGGGNPPSNRSLLFGSDDDRNIQFLGQTTSGVEGTIGAWNGVYNFQSSKIVFNKPAGNVGDIEFHTNQGAGPVKRMTIQHNGVVAIVGALSKGSGSFKIDHPLPSKTETHNLVHSFVESPQANNIYRGKVVLVDGSATINIDTVSGMTDGTYVLLNTNTQCFTSNETGWTAVKGSVSGNTLTITSQVSCTDTISWMVIGERHDQHMIDTDWTNEEGKVIVEPLKENEPE